MHIIWGVWIEDLVWVSCRLSCFMLETWHFSDTEHHRQLDSFECDDEPKLTKGEEVFGPDDAGLVVSEFSDCEDDDGSTDEW